MKKNRILLSAVLCLSLMMFAGCGSSDDNNMNDDSNKSVTEQTVEKDNGSKDKDDSVTQDMKDGAEDMKDGAEDAVDDVKDAMDGNDRNDSAGERNNR